jgi:hypothetical protein
MIALFTNAQYFISATIIKNRGRNQVRTILHNWGWDTIPMNINGVKSYKITYNTTDVFGDPTIASGALYVPQTSCDTMPFVSYQHGTQFDKTVVPSNGFYFGTGLLFSGNGFITTMPDYLGMGVNQGIHPYVHWESEATASIDLIRASREFLNDSLQIYDNNQLFLTGYSQGGHSTMAIHKYISVNNLQDEFYVNASAPLSGSYPLFDAQVPLMIGGDSSYYAPQFVPYTCASYQLVYGNLYSDFNEYYDPPYDSLIASWLASGTNWGTLPTNFYDFMQDSVLDNMQNNPNHPLNIDLRDNDLHNWIPEESVRLLYCGTDSMVFPENSIMALDTMIALGASDIQGLNLDPNADHDGCFIPATTYTLFWFDSLRLDCGLISSIPSLSEKPEITLYPNPVQNITSFSSVEIVSIEIYDMMGKLLIRRNGNQVDMSGMKPGLYFVIGFDRRMSPMYSGKLIKN